MNKLEGFYELNRAGLPSVPWKKYDSSVIFDDDVLWTIRSAVLQGDDLHLPRKIGVRADKAKEFADNLFHTLSENDLVLYYPYFIAEKSGVIEVSNNRTVVEAVKEDLWNLVTYHDREVTVILTGSDVSFIGNDQFLAQNELAQLIDYSKTAKIQFRSILSEGNSVFLEWSFSYLSDINKNPVGEKYLVFYEIRSVC